MVVKRIVKLCCVMIPLIVALTTTNYTVDPGNVFRDTLPDTMAEALLSGKDTYVASGNMDERAVKRAILEKTEEQYECIVFGPSLAMCITHEMVGTSSFQNFGVSAATNYDVFGMFYMLAERHMLPKRVILCVDTMMFDGTRSMIDTRSLMWNDQYRAAKRLFATGVLSDTLEAKYAGYLERINALFSLSYFQQSVQYLSEKDLAHDLIGTVDASYNGAYWRSDGSHVYSQDFQNKTDEEVLLSIEDYIEIEFSGAISRNQHLSKPAIKAFESFVGFCKKQGIDLDLFLVPYPEQVWDEIQQNPIWSLPRELDAYINEYAKQQNLTVIGSYNPYEVGCTVSDFYDNRHLRVESLVKFFDFRAEGKYEQ